MTTELVLLGTAGAPMPVAGRGGISSALIVARRGVAVRVHQRWTRLHSSGGGAPHASACRPHWRPRRHAALPVGHTRERSGPTTTDSGLRAVATGRVAGR